MTPKERPILFNGPMVRAILEGRKTQTRRVVKWKPFDSLSLGDIEAHPDFAGEWFYWLNGGDKSASFICPFGQPGDRLWVRETWAPDDQAPGGFVYREPPNFEPEDIPPVDRWRPSIHMPRRASRITLEISGVRVEQLQQISEEDAWAEGVQPLDGEPDASDHDGSYRASFAHLWDSIAKSGSDWAANPWVWVIEFKRTEVTHA